MGTKVHEGLSRLAAENGDESPLQGDDSPLQCGAQGAPPLFYQAIFKQAFDPVRRRRCIESRPPNDASERLQIPRLDFLLIAHVALRKAQCCSTEFAAFAYSIVELKTPNDVLEVVAFGPPPSPPAGPIRRRVAYR